MLLAFPVVGVTIDLTMTDTSIVNRRFSTDYRLRRASTKMNATAKLLATFRGTSSMPADRLMQRAGLPTLAFHAALEEAVDLGFIERIRPDETDVVLTEQGRMFVVSGPD